MRVRIKDHRGNSGPLVAALRAAGHAVVDRDAGDVLLIDHDLPVDPWLSLCDEYERVFLYPHGAGVIPSADGIWPPHPHTRGIFTIGQGHVDCYAIFDGRPCWPIGWFLCEQRPLEPRPFPRRVLFAPIHPDAYGELPAYWADLARVVHDELARMSIELIVRCDGPPAASGIMPASWVTYTDTSRPMLEAIDDADLVVSDRSTFASVALARGVPVAMYGQDRRPADQDWRRQGHPLMPAARWDEWRERARYPFELGAGDDAGEVLEAAAAGSWDRDVWVDRFIGEPFDPARFAALFARVAGG